jgi:hypothetical protein
MCVWTGKVIARISVSTKIGIITWRIDGPFYDIFWISTASLDKQTRKQYIIPYFIVTNTTVSLESRHFYMLLKWVPWNRLQSMKLHCQLRRCVACRVSLRKDKSFKFWRLTKLTPITHVNLSDHNLYEEIIHAISTVSTCCAVGLDTLVTQKWQHYTCN